MDIHDIHDIAQETRIKTSPMEKKCKKAKWLPGEGLTNSCEKKRSESKGENEKYIYLKAEFQIRARREKKAFLSDQFKETVENKRTGMTRDLFKRLEKPREHLIQRWTQ